MKEKNNLIDIFRYAASIMIAAIHTHPIMDINYELGYILTYILVTIGVPFFFIVAGYFYISKLENGEKPFRKYVVRLLRTYILWSFFYYLIDFIQWGRFDFKNFAVSCVYHFFVGGSHYHFWFFPALIFAVCLTTLIWRLGLKKLVIPMSLVLYALGCIGFAYNKFAVQLPVIGKFFIEDGFIDLRRPLFNGFGVFTAGYAVYRLRLLELPKRRINILLALSAILWCVEAGIIYINKLAFSYELTFMLYPLLVLIMLKLIDNPMPEAGETAAKCRVMADFTYYVHPMCISLFTFLSEKAFGKPVGATVLFFTVIAATSISGLLIRRADNRFLNILIT